MSTIRIAASVRCAATQSVSTSWSGCAYAAASMASISSIPQSLAHGDGVSIYSGRMAGATLNGVSVLVAGAGLAGLSAAHDLTAPGATVTVVDPRNRLAGRARTLRDRRAENQHSEAGADKIHQPQ